MSKMKHVDVMTNSLRYSVNAADMSEVFYGWVTKGSIGGHWNLPF